MSRRQHQASIRRAKKDVKPTGPCDLCAKPWLFVTMGKDRKPIRRRCREHRDTA